MKKVKLLSVVLAVCMLLGALPVFTVNAAEKNPISVSLDSTPDNMYANKPQNFFDNSVVTVKFSDNSTRTITVNKSNTQNISDNDRTDTCGFAQELFLINIDSSTQLLATATIYVSDFATLYVMIAGTSSTTVESKYTYPEDFSCPNAFANNWNGYSTNADGTLTLESYLGDSGDGAVFEIPETVHGKTVTAVADYAFCGDYKPASVTVPKTVTSIGKYAFGYAYSDYDRNGAITSDLMEKLDNAKDTDTFDITISLFDEDYTQQRKDVMAKYFPELTSYNYDDTEGYIYLKAVTKLQILAMKDEDVEHIQIFLQGDDPDANPCGSIEEQLYDYAQTMKSTDTVGINITVYSDEKGTSFKTLAANIMKKYFNNSSKYTLDTYNEVLSTEATAAQIMAMKDDKSVYVETKTPTNMETDLYLSLLSKKDTDKLNIVVTYDGEKNIETYAKSFVEKYFPDCSYETTEDFTSYIIINGATKAQILSVPQDDEIHLNLLEDDDAPRLINNFEIYAARGSAAQQYALENAITFYDISGDNPLGDVNLDGKVDISDSTQIQKYVAKKVTLNKTQLNLADFDKNEKVDISDATAIQKYAAHKI